MIFNCIIVIFRRGGISVVEAYQNGDRSARIMKYWARLNRGHFSHLDL